jgi:hypothetical protein
MRRSMIAAACLLVTGVGSAQEPPEQPAAPAPAPPPESGPEEAAPAEASDAATPGPEYYVEEAPEGETKPAPAAAAPAPAPPAVYEPPPPGYGPVYEPPPPPVPRHVAPKTSFWVGARLGWFIPFGNVFARGTPAGDFILLDSVPWSDYASSGPMFEIDVGMRLSRSYNLFLLWERAQLGSGDAMNDIAGGQTGGDTDFYALGLRASSDADNIGFLTELALGYRRARAVWEDGTELQFTGAILEGRIGLGADIRLSRSFTLAPLATLGVGSFGDIEWQTPDGTTSNAFGPYDQADGHAWFTLNVGGHFDIAGSD